MNPFYLFAVEYRYTNQNQLRKAFWKTFPSLKRKPGGHNNQVADTRCAFVDWIDSLQKNGDISEKLAENATL